MFLLSISVQFFTSVLDSGLGHMTITLWMHVLIALIVAVVSIYTAWTTPLRFKEVADSLQEACGVTLSEAVSNRFRGPDTIATRLQTVTATLESLAMLRADGQGTRQLQSCIRVLRSVNASVAGQDLTKDPLGPPETRRVARRHSVHGNPSLIKQQDISLRSLRKTGNVRSVQLGPTSAHAVRVGSLRGLELTTVGRSQDASRGGDFGTSFCDPHRRGSALSMLGASIRNIVSCAVQRGGNAGSRVSSVSPGVSAASQSASREEYALTGVPLSIESNDLQTDPTLQWLQLAKPAISKPRKVHIQHSAKETKQRRHSWRKKVSSLVHSRSPGAVQGQQAKVDAQDNGRSDQVTRTARPSNPHEPAVLMSVEPQDSNETQGGGKAECTPSVQPMPFTVAAGAGAAGNTKAVAAAKLKLYQSKSNPVPQHETTVTFFSRQPGVTMRGMSDGALGDFEPTQHKGTLYGLHQFIEVLGGATQSIVDAMPLPGACAMAGHGDLREGPIMPISSASPLDALERILPTLMRGRAAEGEVPGSAARPYQVIPQLGEPADWDVDEAGSDGKGLEVLSAGTGTPRRSGHSAHTRTGFSLWGRGQRHNKMTDLTLLTPGAASTASVRRVTHDTAQPRTKCDSTSTYI